MRRVHDWSLEGVRVLKIQIPGLSRAPHIAAPTTSRPRATHGEATETRI